MELHIILSEKVHNERERKFNARRETHKRFTIKEIPRNSINLQALEVLKLGLLDKQFNIQSSAV